MGTVGYLASTRSRICASSWATTLQAGNHLWVDEAAESAPGDIPLRPTTRRTSPQRAGARDVSVSASKCLYKSRACKPGRTDIARSSIPPGVETPREVRHGPGTVCRLTSQERRTRGPGSQHPCPAGFIRGGGRGFAGCALSVAECMTHYACCSTLVVQHGLSIAADWAQSTSWSSGSVCAS